MAYCNFLEGFVYNLGAMPETNWTNDGGRDMPQVVALSTDTTFGPYAGGASLTRYGSISLR